MAILANRVKIRNNLLELSKFTIYSVSRFFSVILIACSCYILYFSTPLSFSNAILETTGKALSAGTLIYDETINSFKWVSSRLSYFKDLETENLKLKLKIAHLTKTIRLTADLQAENRELRKILKTASSVTRTFVTAKVIGTSINPFSSSATLESGKNNNVKINDIVLGKNGLIGRISEVSDNYSTVRFINDHNSRIPVMTGQSKTKGILGKQDDHLKIIYLEEDHSIMIGETVYTSGDGKIFPRGIPIATVIKTNNNTVIVEPIEQFNNIEYVVIESNS